MNIDERIEALVQSVELLYLNSKDSDRRMDEIGQRMNERDRRADEQMAQLRQQIAEHVTTSDRLWKLYTSQDRNLSLHEQRLDEHDNRLHNLDGGYPQNG